MQSNGWPSDLIALAHVALNDLDGLPDATGNAQPEGGVEQVVEWNSVLDMEVFDRLPPGARYALNYADLSYSSSQVLLMAIDKGLDPDTLGYKLVVKLAMPSKDKPNPFTWTDAPRAAAMAA